MRRVLLVPVAALLLAGCGSSANGTPKEVFASTCGGCHTLKAAGTDGNIGPNLDELAPSVDTVKAAINNGPGNMPGGLLGGDKVEQVAAYVANSAGN